MPLSDTRGTIRDEREYLLLVRFSHHITCHIPYALVDNLRHCRHDTLSLRAIEALALQPLHEMMRVKVEVQPLRGRVELQLGDGNDSAEYRLGYPRRTKSRG